MLKQPTAAVTLAAGLLVLTALAGCDNVVVPDLGDLINLNDNSDDGPGDAGGPTGEVAFSVVATNTNGASGMALRPSDGALFTVNADGLYGPIADGADLATMDPIGATNLATPDLFDFGTDSLVLAITNSGEFWIASPCCQVVAVVPPEGGDAVPYEALFSAELSSTLKAETMVIVPEGFDGPQMAPGRLLLGQETTFSWLVAIDVEGDQTAVDVENPTIDADEDDPASTNREAHHLTFGLDGVLYSARGASGLTLMGFQTIDPDGTPHPIDGTLGLAAESFVALATGDLIIRGTHQTGPTTVESGILLYRAAEGETTFALEIPQEERSEDDEMTMTPTGDAIYLSLPQRNEIVMVEVVE